MGTTKAPWGGLARIISQACTESENLGMGPPATKGWCFRRETIFEQQQTLDHLRILAIRLLLAYSLGPDLRRVSGTFTVSNGGQPADSRPDDRRPLRERRRVRNHGQGGAG
jgi:hypothetical protein